MPGGNFFQGLSASLEQLFSNDLRNGFVTPWLQLRSSAALLSLCFHGRRNLAGEKRGGSAGNHGVLNSIPVA